MVTLPKVESPVTLLRSVPQVDCCPLGHWKSVEKTPTIISLACKQRSIAGLPLRDNEVACHIGLTPMEFTKGPDPDDLGDSGFFDLSIGTPACHGYDFFRQARIDV